MKLNLLLTVLLLQGCAAVVDTGVAATTGKTVASHALSEVHKQDCDTFRVFKGQDVCRKVYYGESYYKR
jgi:uncharacterized protein YceK